MKTNFFQFAVEAFKLGKMFQENNETVQFFFTKWSTYLKYIEGNHQAWEWIKTWSFPGGNRNFPPSHLLWSPAIIIGQSDQERKTIAGQVWFQTEKNKAVLNIFIWGPFDFISTVLKSGIYSVILHVLGRLKAQGPSWSGKLRRTRFHHAFPPRSTETWGQRGQQTWKKISLWNKG